MSRAKIVFLAVALVAALLGWFLVSSGAVYGFSSEISVPSVYDLSEINLLQLQDQKDLFPEAKYDTQTR